MTTLGTGNPAADLDRSNPPARTVQLGTTIALLIASNNALLAKMDAIGAAGASSAAIAAAAGTTNVATNTVAALGTLPIKNN